MGALSSLFASAEPLLFNGLGVPFTYYPLDGAPRSIAVLFRRTGISPQDDNRIDQILTIDICAKNDATNGILPGEIQVGDRGRFDSDPAEEFYTFKGEAGEECPSSGWFTFTKRVNVRTGGTIPR